MRKVLLALVVIALLAAPAAAHTISIGSFNAGLPGSVALVLGTYSHGAGITQGSMQLIAGPGIPPLSPIVGMGPLLLAKPAGLIDGVSNFYADANGGAIPYGSILSNSYNQPTNTVGLGPVVNWQGATFFGLATGLYTYQLTGMTSQNWNNVNSFAPNWTGTLFVPGTSTGVPVPEPTTLLLLGTGLAVVGYRRRRTQR